jgi:hypothetical protein
MFLGGSELHARLIFRRGPPQARLSSDHISSPLLDSVLDIEGGGPRS